MVRIKTSISISLSGGERLLLDGIRAASEDLLFITAMLGFAYWIIYGGGAELMGAWSAVGYMGGGFLALIAMCGIPEALEVMRPYWRFARWIHKNETMTGQLSLFPHTGAELQLRPRSEQLGIKAEKESKPKVLRVAV